MNPTYDYFREDDLTDWQKRWQAFKDAFWRLWFTIFTFNRTLLMSGPALMLTIFAVFMHITKVDCGGLYWASN